VGGGVSVPGRAANLKANVGWLGKVAEDLVRACQIPADSSYFLVRRDGCLGFSTSGIACF